MIAFPDTSFLCAFYRRQDNSAPAAAYFKAMSEALHVSGLLLYEFRQRMRFQVWLHARDKNKGYPRADGDRALPTCKLIWTLARWWWQLPTGRTFTAWPKPCPNATPLPAGIVAGMCSM